MNIFAELINESDKERNRVVVRLRTTTWADNRGIHQKRSILFLKKQSLGHNMLQEDISCVGAEDVLPKIVNLNECEDGIYEVYTCNESRDWETGYVDDWDYKLQAIDS